MSINTEDNSTIEDSSPVVGESLNSEDSAGSPAATPVTPTESDEPSIKPTPVYRRSLLVAPLILFAPRWAGRMSARANLLLVLILHLAATIAFFQFGVLLAAWYQAVAEGNLFSFVDQLNEIVDDIFFSEYDRLLRIASIGFFFAMVECGHLALVFLVWPWTARDEPITDSFNAAIRRVMLWTAGVFVPAVVLLTPAFTIMAHHDYLRDDYWQGNQWATYDQWRDSLPLLYRYPEVIMATTWSGLVLWALWALLRFTASDRPAVPLPRETICETCGYNLLHMEMDQSCPECGMGVHNSLGKHVRPGVPWQRERNFLRLKEWFTTLWMAFRHPIVMGKSVHTRAYSRSHHSFLWLTLLWSCVISLMGIACLTIMEFVRWGRMPEFYNEILPLFIGTIMTCTLIVLAVTLFSAMLCGVVQSLWNRRNLMYPAMQGSCYLGGITLVWTGIFWFFVIMANTDLWWPIFEWINSVTRIYEENVMVLFWIFGNSFFLGLYVFLNSRITKYARFANK